LLDNFFSFITAPYIEKIKNSVAVGIYSMAA